MDEFWSFVQNKSNQRWTWYAIERKSGCVLAWHNGKRQDKDFLVLWDLLEIFDIDKYHTDDWGAYSKYIPPDKHIQSKAETYTIEGYNSRIRHYLARFRRKSKCYSKAEYMIEISLNLLFMKLNSKLSIPI
jgi:insertion element IS1 protein InsB